MAKSKQKQDESSLRYTVRNAARSPGFVIIDNRTNMQHSGPFEEDDAREKARRLNSREAASIAASDLRRLG